MTPQEKVLYHQIHPLKLLTDSSAEVLSLYLFWQRKLLAGLIVLLVPPIITSTLIILLAWLREILLPKRPSMSQTGAAYTVGNAFTQST